ncbi:hypothetical protein [Micrococcus sp.]|uniref:hypothetical protein n=1 Tax=Micrococcus sp. TaxID=1271 RepID=UPI002A909F64|nr:hypothetical protein [Micrococcus sp.]MDY6056073.1 hypothetical protein [Micrococcus sp.]
MEVWTLDHPDRGLIELRQGFDAEFLAADPDWPVPEGVTADDSSTPEDLERAPADASLPTRVRRWRATPPLRLEVRVDGAVVGRYLKTGSVDLPLTRRPEDGPITKLAALPSDTLRTGARLRVRATRLGELVEATYRDEDTVAELDPPADSRGAQRRQAMEDSPLKRVAYPLLGGIGKAGWVIAMILLIPLLRRLLPDWELPSVHVPQVHLPAPAFQQIHLPAPTFQQIHLPVPGWQLPEWVFVVIEHNRIWMPVVIGLGIGVGAVRNHRRSERQKASWAARDRPPRRHYPEEHA